MALTQAQKDIIIHDLSIAANFHANYNASNRSWFITHMIEFYANNGVADSSIRSTISTFLPLIKTLVTAKQNFTCGIPFSAALERTQLTRRVEMIYGVIANYPGLQLAVNNNLLEFIIKRRYRAVMRMDYYVNPNSYGYFRYPEACSSSAPYKVNDSATAQWTAVSPGVFRLATPASVVTALTLVFTRKTAACEGNLFDCSRVMATLLMEGLFEAADRNVLMPYLSAKSASFLSIAAIGTETPFIYDSSPEGLFVYKTVSSNDLQTGDYAYIYNHPLYKIFNPDGSWRGEHALVYSCGNRNIRDPKGYYFGGHGMEGTLYQFYSGFMKELKTHLERTYYIAKIHLAVRAAGVISNGTHTLAGGGTVNITTSGGKIFFEYTRTISYTNYATNKPEGRLRFLIVHLSGQPTRFFIDGSRTLAAYNTAGAETRPVFISRTATPAISDPLSTVYDPAQFGVEYTDKNNAVQRFLCFERVGGNIRFHQITMNDLFASPFFGPSGTTDVSSFQPLVDLTPAYSTFLRGHGAIL